MGTIMKTRMVMVWQTERSQARPTRRRRRKSMTVKEGPKMIKVARVVLLGGSSRKRAEAKRRRTRRGEARRTAREEERRTASAKRNCCLTKPMRLQGARRRERRTARGEPRKIVRPRPRRRKARRIVSEERRTANVRASRKTQEVVVLSVHLMELQQCLLEVVGPHHHQAPVQVPRLDRRAARLQVRQVPAVVHMNMIMNTMKTLMVMVWPTRKSGAKLMPRLRRKSMTGNERPNRTREEQVALLAM